MDRLNAAAAAPRVAVVGGGYWGKNLVRNFAQLGALAAVVERDETIARGLQAQHGCALRSYDDVLVDPAVDAIVIATPGPSHFVLAEAALHAGKHVYVEKPLCLTTAHAAALVALAHDAKRTLMAGHILRYHPAFLALEALVQRGDLGRVRHVISTRFNMGKILPDEDVIWSLGPHDVSMVFALLGEGYVGLNVQADAFLRAGVADIATLRLAYPQQVSAELRLSWLSPYKEHKLTVLGEKAMAVFDDTQPLEHKLRLYRPALDWTNAAVSPPLGAPECVPVMPDEPLKSECRHFLDCCATGQTPRTDGRNALAVVRLLEEAQTLLRGAH